MGSKNYALISGSFHVKWTNAPHLTVSDFDETLYA